MPKITINGKEKNLSLDWNPITVDEIIEKLMVTLRDVTQLRKTEKEALTTCLL